MSAPSSTQVQGRVPLGVSGLDYVLGGGIPRSRFYLIHGRPGTGKTTLALHFLLEGRRSGETGLYVTLSETKDELHDVARSHGWSLDGIGLYELESIEHKLQPEEQYTVFHPAEVELGETTERICQEVERLKPTRVVFDSLSEMRLMARDPLRYRRQILALKQFFVGRDCTVLLLDDQTEDGQDVQLQTMSHGVIILEKLPVEYGAARRRLSISKMRGVEFLDGYHDFTIRPGALTVYPRLVAAATRHSGRHQQGEVSSGVEGLDALLGGGVYRGTSVLVTGPAGSGKSSVVSRYLYAAAQRGEKSAAFIFEEGLDTFMARAASLDMDLRPHVDAGLITVQQVDPAELTPGEFTDRVRECAERGASIISIDSLNGYLHAMPSEQFLLVQMHELLTYLNARGAVTFLTLAQHGLVGGLHAPLEFSYVADAVVMLRYFESGGQVRKAISVLKQRRGRHEDAIREFRMSSSGITIGDPLHEFQGILTGVPVYRGESGALLNNTNDGQ